jgi:hypothetical protein
MSSSLSCEKYSGRAKKGLGRYFALLSLSLIIEKTWLFVLNREIGPFCQAKDF